MADDILFSVLNQDGQQTLVAGEVNQLTLTITNNTIHPLALKGGPPVPESQAPSGPSSLYLSFGDLLSMDAQKAITIAASGWTPHFFDGPGGGWALARDVSGPWPAGVPQTVVISGVHAPAAARPGQFTVDYYNLGNLTDSSGLDLPVRKKPSGRGAPSLTAAWVESKLVFITTDPTKPVANSLTFTITNGSRTPLVPANVPWGSEPPVFQLAFVCAKRPGYGALTTNERAAAIDLKQAQVYGDVWKPVPNQQAKPPYWELAPQNHDVLGVDQSASVQFTLSNIITELEPGITVLYLQYANLPGYDDGDIGPALTIEKRLPASVAYFTASPSIVDLSGGRAQVTLNWQADHAEVVSITNQGIVNQAETPQTFVGSRVVTVYGRTPFVLQASATQLSAAGATAALEVLSIHDYLPGSTVPVIGGASFQDMWADERLQGSCSVSGSVSFAASGAATCNLSMSGWEMRSWLDPDGKWQTGDQFAVPGQSASRSGTWALSGTTVTLNSPQGSLQFAFGQSQGRPVLTLQTAVFVVDGHKVPG